MAFSRPHGRLWALLFACALCLVLTVPHPCPAATMKTGFMVLSFSLPEENQRLDIAVWYPTVSSRRVSVIHLHSWRFAAARDAAPAEGPWPLVLISHPSGGSRFSAHNTAMALAAEGFVVAAVTHPLDNWDAMPQNYTWPLFDQRCRDLSRAADLLLAHEKLGPSINAARIGVLGFGTGGTTTLLLGGALPDCSAWENFCGESASTRDPYCNRWARDRIAGQICTALPLTKSLADTRVKAVATVQPSFSMLLTGQSLRCFYPSALLVTTDTGQASEEKALAGLERRFPRLPEHFRSKASGLQALLADVPEELREDLPELLPAEDKKTLNELRRDFVAALVQFFDRSLVQAAPRVIPDPPDLAPVVEKPEPRPEDSRQAKGKKTPRTK